MLNFKKNKSLSFGILFVFLGIVYFPIFLHLDSKPLREWDEARNAVNAFEMSQTNQFLIKTYQYQPDLWETKPPLLVWLQTIGFKLIGVNEMAVRLPSALATFFLILFLLYFFNTYFKAPQIGIFSSLILITSHGFMFEHCTRTGDHDALLICFEIIMLLHFYLYITYKTRASLLCFSLFLMLCIYTKSIACFLFLPGILIYLLVSGQFIVTVKDKRLWIGFLLALTGALLYYALREFKAKGYLNAVWQNELFPRYFNTSDTYQYNPKDLWFYFKEIYEKQFSEWYILLIPSILLNEICSGENLKKLHRFILINAVAFFIVLSNGTTNSSYILPLMPLFSIIIGIAFYNIGQLLFINTSLQANIKWLLFLLLLLSIFYNPYDKVIEKALDTSENNPQVQYPYVFKHIEKSYPGLKQFYIYEPSASNYPLVFYTYVFNQLKHFDIRAISSENLKLTGADVIVFEEQLTPFNQTGVPYEILFRERDLLFVKTHP